MTTAAATTLPAPGLHHGVPFDVYASWPAVSSSSVLKRMRRSAQYAKATEGQDVGGTPDTAIGNAFHHLLLEPERFASRFVVAGTCEATVKSTGAPCRLNGSRFVSGGWYCGTKGHAPAVAVDAPADERTILDGDDLARATALADAVRADPHASEVLRLAPMREVSLVWIDRWTRLPCKGRVDVFGHGQGRVRLWDVKKSARAHPDEFEREILKRGWHQQIAHYDSGLRALGLTPDEVGFIVVHDCKADDVHEVGVYDLVTDALELGREKNEKALAEYAACLRANRWPGWGRRPVSVPTYALARDEDDVEENNQGGD